MCMFQIRPIKHSIFAVFISSRHLYLAWLNHLISWIYNVSIASISEAELMLTPIARVKTRW
jgi:hypothetical protein